MVLSLAVILVVLIIAYIWASRGLFSAMIHMLCTLVAGAVAFGTWELIAYAILRSTGEGWIIDLAWGVSLALPFGITLGALRLMVDKMLPANVDVDNISNLVGGGLCGAVSGTITAGILVISMGLLRLPNGYMGYQPVVYDSSGSLKVESGLLFPADKMTAALYSFMSESALRTSTPMATLHPDMAMEGPLLRVNFNEGGSKHTLEPKAFEVMGRYTVGETGTAPIKSLLTDSFFPGRTQKLTYLDGTDANPQSYIEGFVVNFKAGAKEKNGRVVIGNGQIRLVCQNADGSESMGLQPMAMISQAEGDKRDLGRWRFDAQNIYIASVGGAAEATMGFEFLVPRGFTPLALYVKGVRVDVSQVQAAMRFDETAKRDAAIKSGAVFTSLIAPTGDLDRSEAVKVVIAAGNDPNFLVGGFLIEASSILKDNLGALEIDEANKIVDGEQKLANKDTSNRGVQRNLQVTELAATEDTSIVQLVVGNDNKRWGLLSPQAQGADTSKPMMLIDDKGQRYVAIGYMYRDPAETHIRMTPGRPIRSVSELSNGGPTPSRPDQKFRVIFRVSKGVKVTGFAVGNKVIAEFNPPVTIDKGGF